MLPLPPMPAMPAMRLLYRGGLTGSDWRADRQECDSLDSPTMAPAPQPGQHKRDVQTEPEQMISLTGIRI